MFHPALRSHECERGTQECVRHVLLLMVLLTPCAAQFTRPPFQIEPAQLERQDLRDMLGLLCPGQEYIGQESGCHVCPSQLKAARARTDASIESAVRGHFLKPESDDLLLVLDGCGAVLFTHSTSGWFVSQTDKLPVGQCRKVPAREGRDGLVCFAVSSSADRQNARLTFGYIPGESADLLGAFDNTAGACDAPKRVVVQSAIQDVKFVPGAEGKVTLRITASCRRGLLSARSLKACASGTGFEDISPAAPFRTFRVDYGFNGDAFSIVAVSRAVKLAYDVCAKDGN
jgi:hypothetical protein